jgi:hypothetical protein
MIIVPETLSVSTGKVSHFLRAFLVNFTSSVFKQYLDIEDKDKENI